MNATTEGFENAPVLPSELSLTGVGTEFITSLQHRADLIFLSYRFSQGGIGTQNRMLLYIEENFDSGIMGAGNLDQLNELTHRMVGRYFLNQKLHPATAIPWEDDSPEASIKTDQLVANELTGLFERFRDRKQIATFSSDVAGIAQSVIVMDADYLSRPGGRAGDSEALKIVVSPFLRDPYDSMFIKYSVLGTSTNTVEFDSIFRLLANNATMQQFDQYTLRQLQYVINTYTDQHPEGQPDERIAQVSAVCEGLLHARRS